MRVSNGNVIKKLSFRSMRAARVRNRVAVTAIALTAVLFTALFTVALSFAYSFEQSNFRQVGGYAHGALKYLTKEQVELFAGDSLIKAYGLRIFVGMPKEKPFHKSHVEVSYTDANEAQWLFAVPEEGRLPKENTNEAATDTRVLELLGVTPKLGTEFTITFDVDGTKTTQTFTLCGWWEYDSVSIASHVLIPKSRAEQIFTDLGTEGKDGITGTYTMEMMFPNSMHIAENIETLLSRYGYHTKNELGKENFIATGVNWGYISSQLFVNMDSGTVLSLTAALLLIIFTGYLIIYNVFKISISNDIRSYGLLKTIGTTARQIRRIVWMQSIVLSCIGIPIGLAAGYGIGVILTPMILETFQQRQIGHILVNPWIFIISAVFAFATVMISCRKPAKIAGKVTAIEALRYVEKKIEYKQIFSIKRRIKPRKLASLEYMAFANLGRDRGKTVVTMLSLSLSVVLMQITVVFTNGFDMDKYLRKVVSDYILADASYFQVQAGFRRPENALPEEVIQEIAKQRGIVKGGCTYGQTRWNISEFVTEEDFRKGKISHFVGLGEEELESLLFMAERENGLLQTDVKLYGMEAFCLEKLKVISGDISKLFTGGNYIAAVYMPDDYENVIPDSNWAEVGDKVKLRYTEKYEFYNPWTQEIYQDSDDLTNVAYKTRSIEYRDAEYEVAATVLLPSNMSYRYYGNDEFIMGAETFIRETGTDGVMYYAFDVEDAAKENMDAFIADYTQNIRSDCDYESRESYEKQFQSLKNTFLIVGGILVFIVGLVGVLNFFNAILTGIYTRIHEFAVLQSVGMTGKQLKTMLVIEGLFYALGSVAVSLIISIVTGPLVGKVLGSMFWFFSYRFTIVPILLAAPLFALLGFLLPLMTYRTMAKKSIVERLREI